MLGTCIFTPSQALSAGPSQFIFTFQTGRNKNLKVHEGSNPSVREEPGTKAPCKLILLPVPPHYPLVYWGLSSSWEPLSPINPKRQLVALFRRGGFRRAHPHLKLLNASSHGENESFHLKLLKSSSLVKTKQNKTQKKKTRKVSKTSLKGFWVWLGFFFRRNLQRPHFRLFNFSVSSYSPP